MADVPGKRGPDVLNKSVEKIVIGSKGSHGLVHLTKKATTARIRADLEKQHGGISLLRHLAIVALKRKGLHSTISVGLAKSFNRKSTRGLMSSWKTLVAAEMRRILSARLRSRAATVAGWLYGLQKLRGMAGMSGGSGGARVELQPRGSASKSKAKSATNRSLIAILENGVEDSGIVCHPTVIQAAINSATADNIVYLKRKFGEGIEKAINA